jgi:hypothetical protein
MPISNVAMMSMALTTGREQALGYLVDGGSARGPLQLCLVLRSAVPVSRPNSLRLMLTLGGLIGMAAVLSMTVSTEAKISANKISSNKISANKISTNKLADNI